MFLSNFLTKFIFFPIFSGFAAPFHYHTGLRNTGTPVPWTETFFLLGNASRPVCFLSVQKTRNDEGILSNNKYLSKHRNWPESVNSLWWSDVAHRGFMADRSWTNQRSVFRSRDLYIDQSQTSVYLRPARLLVPLVVGVEDTEVTTGGEEVEAWGWSVCNLAGVITALGGSSMASLEPEATDTMGINSVAMGSRTC